MSLLRYIKDRIISVIMFAGVSIIVAALLSILGIDGGGISFIMALYGLAFIGGVVIDYGLRYGFYKQVKNNLEGLESKYLLSEMIDYPSFYEGQLLYECLKEANKAMNDEINRYAVASKEYREYIELWIHEVKTPIASTKLIIENHPSVVTNSIDEEIDIINDYLVQALFYSRSNTLQQDYIIKEVSLKTMIFSVMRKHSKGFIRNKVRHSMADLEYSVNTDAKWVEYILEQVISNAIKYRSTEPFIELYGIQKENAVLLCVKDNGIGISEKDIGKVFEKGFTGSTGRQYTKATGLGLYLAKKLCVKMGLSITIESEVHVGTTVTITFPKSNFMKMGKSDSNVR